jgi:hypothetical protein
MIRSWLRNEKEAIACALSSGQLFRLPDSAPYFLRQCFLSASSYSIRKIQIVPRIYTLLNDSKDDAACRHAERILAADFTPTGDDVLRMRQVLSANSEFFILFIFYLFTCYLLKYGIDSLLPQIRSRTSKIYDFSVQMVQ